MTEKITVTAAMQKGTTQKGNPIYACNLADGRTNVTCFDKEIVEKLNQEIEVDIKESVYNGAQQYTINLPGKNNGFRGSGFNLGFNQKKTALEAAANSLMGNSPDDGALILRRADKFLEWMQK